MSIFGAKVAIVYGVVGPVIAVAGGTIIEKLQMEKQIETSSMAAALKTVTTFTQPRRNTAKSGRST